MERDEEVGRELEMGREQENEGNGKGRKGQTRGGSGKRPRSAGSVCKFVAIVILCVCACGRYSKRAFVTAVRIVAVSINREGGGPVAIFFGRGHSCCKKYVQKTRVVHKEKKRRHLFCRIVRLL